MIAQGFPPGQTRRRIPERMRDHMTGDIIGDVWRHNEDVRAARHQSFGPEIRPPRTTGNGGRKMAGEEQEFHGTHP